MNKKVYFAGSIRGGRNDAALYAEMIARINETDMVLTEHIGNLSLSVLEKARDQDQKIYIQDTEWIKQCDILIAECTNPSLGVGYELCFAEKLSKPCHIFYNKSGTNLSAMLKGDGFFFIHPYENEAELFAELDRILQSL